jgi:hypothetical protein
MDPVTVWAAPQKVTFMRSPRYSSADAALESDCFRHSTGKRRPGAKKPVTLEAVTRTLTESQFDLAIRYVDRREQVSSETRHGTLRARATLLHGAAP